MSWIKISFEKKGVKGRLILKWKLKKWNVRMWIAYNWPRIRYSGCSTTERNFFYELSDYQLVKYDSALYSHSIARPQVNLIYSWWKKKFLISRH
jgi:hypothetical protein